MAEVGYYIVNQRYKIYMRGNHKLIYEIDIVGNNQTRGLAISRY